MSADYTLGFVQRDGNMHDERSYGASLTGALYDLRLYRERDTAHRHSIHWYVYDADDPERGYFDSEDDAA